MAECGDCGLRWLFRCSTRSLKSTESRLLSSRDELSARGGGGVFVWGGALLIAITIGEDCSAIPSPSTTLCRRRCGLGLRMFFGLRLRGSGLRLRVGDFEEPKSSLADGLHMAMTPSESDLCGRFRREGLLSGGEGPGLLTAPASSFGTPLIMRILAVSLMLFLRRGRSPCFFFSCEDGSSDVGFVAKFAMSSQWMLL